MRDKYSGIFSKLIVQQYESDITSIISLHSWFSKYKNELNSSSKATDEIHLCLQIKALQGFHKNPENLEIFFLLCVNIKYFYLPGF